MAASVTVSADALNLRSGPGTGYQLVGTVLRGTTLEVLERSGDWVKVRTPRGSVAWVAGWLVTSAPAGGTQPPDGGTAPTAPAVSTVIVAVDLLNLRGGPGTGFNIVEQVRRSTSLGVLGSQGDWLKVTTPAGRTAWAAGWLVSKPATQPTQPPQPAPPTAPTAGYEDLSANLATASPKSGSLNVRSGPSTGNPVVGQAQAGHSYPALGRQGDWIKISLPNGTTGWMAGWLSNLKVLTLNDFAVWDGGREVLALAKTVPVRRMPREDFEGTVDVPAGTRLEYLTSQDGWHRVRTSSGVAGWVEASATKLVSKAPFSQSPVYTLDTGVWQVTEPTPATITGSGVNMRSGPGTGYAAITQLSQGTAARILASQSGWYHLELADGRDGWVYGTLVRPGSGPQVARVEVNEVSAQKKLVTIQGSFSGTATLKEFSDGKSLALYLGSVSVNPAALEINTKEIANLHLSGNGLLLNFRELPKYRLVTNSPGNIQLELSTSLESLALTKEENREVLVFQTRGFASPTARYDQASGQIEVRFPETSFGGQAPTLQSDLVQGVTVSTDASGTLVRIASPAKGRFLTRRGVSQISLELLEAGLQGKTIVVDPGHGGYDPGAAGAAGVQEKTVNLTIGLKLKAMLEQAGAKVLMTRTGDTASVPDDQLAAVPKSERLLTDLSARTELANQNRADLYISVHNNYDPAKRQLGTAVYWTSTNFNADRSLAFASLAQQRIVQALGRPDNGTKNNDFYVVRYAEAPSVLLENLFLSDAAEERMLMDDAVLTRVAQAVFDAALAYYQ